MIIGDKYVFLIFHRTDVTLLRQERQPSITLDCLIFYGYQYLLPIRQFQTIDSCKMFGVSSRNICA